MIVNTELIFKASAPNAFAASACACGVTALNHKIRNNSVKNYSVIVSVFGMSCKILNRFGSSFWEKKDFNITHCCLHKCNNIALLRFSYLFAHFYIILSYLALGSNVSESFIKSIFAILVLGKLSITSIFLGHENLARFFLQYD